MPAGTGRGFLFSTSLPRLPRLRQAPLACSAEPVPRQLQPASRGRRWQLFPGKGSCTALWALRGHLPSGGSTGTADQMPGAAGSACSGLRKRQGEDKGQTPRRTKEPPASPLAGLGGGAERALAACVWQLKPLLGPASCSLAPPQTGFPSCSPWWLWWKGRGGQWRATEAASRRPRPSLARLVCDCQA